MRDIFDDGDDGKNSGNSNNGQNKDTGASEFARMFEDSLKGVGKTLSVGDKIRGEVLTIGKEEIFVSTGTMNDGVVLKKDLLDAEGKFNHKVGDFLDLYVTQVKGANIMLSPKPTAKNLADDLEDAFDMILPVEGRVTEICNGGFRVNVLGKTAFCPISQIDLRRVDDASSYVGQKFEFMITQFSERGRNIVVSRRKLLEEQKEASQGAFAEDHKPGDRLKGVITRLEKFGAFVEVAPGLEGLVHISEISWSRLGDPSEAVQVGQQVNVKLLKIEEGINGRMNVSLSIKQAEPEPWAMVPDKFPVGTTVRGRVERREPYGLFIRIDEGVTGLLPKSTANENPTFPFEKLKLGDEVTVQVAEVRASERRISLAPPRDPDAEAWRGFASTTLSPTGSSSSSAGPGAGLGTLGEQFNALFQQQQQQQQQGGVKPPAAPSFSSSKNSKKK